MFNWTWRLKSAAPYNTGEDVEQVVQRLEVEMKAAAKKLEFERAAELRNRIQSAEAEGIGIGTIGPWASESESHLTSAYRDRRRVTFPAR